MSGYEILFTESIRFRFVSFRCTRRTRNPVSRTRTYSSNRSVGRSRCFATRRDATCGTRATHHPPTPSSGLDFWSSPFRVTLLTNRDSSFCGSHPKARFPGTRFVSPGKMKRNETKHMDGSIDRVHRSIDRSVPFSLGFAFFFQSFDGRIDRSFPK